MAARLYPDLSPFYRDQHVEYGATLNTHTVRSDKEPKSKTDILQAVRDKFSDMLKGQRIYPELDNKLKTSAHNTDNSKDNIGGNNTSNKNNKSDSVKNELSKCTPILPTAPPEEISTVDYFEDFTESINRLQNCSTSDSLSRLTEPLADYTFETNESTTVSHIVSKEDVEEEAHFPCKSKNKMPFTRVSASQGFGVVGSSEPPEMWPKFISRYNTTTFSNHKHELFSAPLQSFIPTSRSTRYSNNDMNSKPSTGPKPNSSLRPRPDDNSNKITSSSSPHNLEPKNLSVATPFKYNEVVGQYDTNELHESIKPQNKDDNSFWLSNDHVKQSCKKKLSSDQTSVDHHESWVTWRRQMNGHFSSVIFLGSDKEEHNKQKKQIIKKQPTQSCREKVFKRNGRTTLQEKTYIVFGIPRVKSLKAN